MRNGPLSPDYLAGTAGALGITFERWFMRPHEAHLEDHPDLGRVVICSGIEPYQLEESIAEIILNLDHTSPEAHLAFVREYGPLSPDARISQDLGAGLYVDRKVLLADIERGVSIFERASAWSKTSAATWSQPRWWTPPSFRIAATWLNLSRHSPRTPDT